MATKTAENITLTDKQPVATAITAIQDAELKAQVIGEKFVDNLVNLYIKMKGIELANMPNDVRSRLFNIYFGIQRAMTKINEEKAASDPICNWNTIVNRDELYEKAVHCAEIGLDMKMDNHLYAVIRKQKGKVLNEKDLEIEKDAIGWTCTLQEGYLGKKYVAEKYADDDYLGSIIELVYSNDKFAIKKKSISNVVENYDFEVTNPFDRGEIVGGFGYIQYEDSTKNKLVTMSKKDIDKRKDSANMKVMWSNWYEEQAEKTLIGYVFSKKNFKRDPKKIDDSIRRLDELEVKEQLLLASEPTDNKQPTLPVIDIPPPEGVEGEVAETGELF